MVVLALVLLIIVLVFSVAIVVSNPGVYEISLFRVLVPVTSAGIFFTGFGAALLTVIAALLLRGGIRRSRQQRERLQTAERAAINTAALVDPQDSAERSERSDPTVSPAADPDASDSTPATSSLELDLSPDATTSSTPASSTPAAPSRRIVEPENERDEPRI